MFFKYLLREWLYLTEPLRFESSPFKTEIESTYAAEQASYG